MKKALKLFLNLTLITITSQCFAQTLALGTDENTVYNTLYDMVNSYNRAQNSNGIRHFEAIRYNGAVREIIVSINDLYFYDLRLTSDCVMHYVIRDGVLHHIITQYGNLSTEQLTIGFNRIYGDRHLENYYFSDDFKSFKTISLDVNGLATVTEESTYDTRFPPQIASALNEIGVANKFPLDQKKKALNQGTNIRGKAGTKNNVNNTVNKKSNFKSAAKGSDLIGSVSSTREEKPINVDSINGAIGKLTGTKQMPNLSDMIEIVGRQSLSVTELKDIIQKASSRNWKTTVSNDIISFSWNLDNSEYMAYNIRNHTFLIESDYDEDYNNIIKELELNKYRKVIDKPEEGQLSKIRYQNDHYSILCCKDEGGSMGNRPCTITVSRLSISKDNKKHIK